MSNFFAELDSNLEYFLNFFLCYSQQQATDCLSLICFTGIFSVTFLNPDNQQNNKPSSDL